jgi:RNA-directed DNA polymerase
LELKPSKTRITHTLEGDAGFDFLGFNVRQHRVGKTHSARNPRGAILGFKTIITPSKPAIKEHVAALGQIVREHQAAPQEALIGKLNPVIQGWANYHRAVVAQATFDLCDDHVYSMLRRWARRRHPKKRAKWVVRKYWTTYQDEHWAFKAQDGSMLKRHAKTPIRRHVKVQGTASPYDGDLL